MAESTSSLRTAKQIGTVEILRARTYALDSESPEPRLEAIVHQGEYPLYQNGITRFWLMTGHLNLGGMRRMGDGMFSLTPADIDSDIEVRFPSRTFGPDEWQELTADPCCREGDDNQRLRIRVLP